MFLLPWALDKYKKVISQMSAILVVGRHSTIFNWSLGSLALTLSVPERLPKSTKIGVIHHCWRNHKEVFRIYQPCKVIKVGSIVQKNETTCRLYHINDVSRIGMSKKQDINNASSIGMEWLNDCCEVYNKRCMCTFDVLYQLPVHYGKICW